jgi:hypothetical protein
MRNTLLRILWALTVFVALSASALYWTDAYGRTALPFYRWELSWIAPDYEIQTLALDHSDPQPRFRVLAMDKLGTAESSQARGPAAYMVFALVMSSLQPVILALFLPLAWPGLAWKRRIAALLWAVPILGAVQFADVPWTLLGNLDAAKAHNNHSSATFAMTWSALLGTGARLALGLAAGVIACQIPVLLDSYRQRKKRTGKAKKRTTPRRLAGIQRNQT